LIDMRSMAAFKQAVLRLVADSPAKISVHDLQRHLVGHFDLAPGAVRSIIKDLVSAGLLAYTQEFGRSFLEESFQRPVQVTSRIFLCPPRVEAAVSAAGCVQIHITPGAAFGCGRHPSTRLALRGIEQAMTAAGDLRQKCGTLVLDIGTGSGILVMAAVKLGIRRGIGIDTDPVARAEAGQNVRLNQLAQRVVISDEPLEKVAAARRFTMITANLRIPTLLRLCEMIRTSLTRKGYAVLAGIKNEELPDVQTAYGRQGLFTQWQASEKGWSAVVLRAASPELNPNTAKES
jgi:ribosomal protein L11 methyltransferase